LSVLKRITLGNSLVSNMLCSVFKLGNTLLVDNARRTSILFGWDYSMDSLSACIDIIPIFLDRSSVEELQRIVKNLLVRKVRVESEVVGTLEGYLGKLGNIKPQINWIERTHDEVYLITDGFCKVFRAFEEACVNKLFGEIKSIDPENRKVKVLNNELSCDELLITLPLDYVINKLRNVPKDYLLIRKLLKYRSALVMTLIIKGKLIKDNLVKIIKVGKKGFLSTAVIVMSSRLTSELLSMTKNELTTIYVLSLISLKELRAEMDRVLITEVKRLLNVSTVDTVFMRQAFVKYALINELGKEGVSLLNDLIKYLRSKGTYLVGRLATWRDMCIGELIKHLRNQIKLS